MLRDRRERLVAHLAAGEDRDRFVEERRELPQDAALRLAAKTQEDEVVARQERVDDLRHHGVLIAPDAGEELVARLELPHQVGPDLVLHGSALVSRGPELAQRPGAVLTHPEVLQLGGGYPRRRPIRPSG